MLPLNATQIHASGPMKISQFKKHRCVVLHVLSTGIAFLIRAILNTTNGISGYFLNFTNVAWLIAKIQRLTGAQVVKLF